MPTFTAFQTFPHRAGVTQFAVDLTAEWEKLDDCRIGGVLPRASLRVFIPGWRIRAAPDVRPPRVSRTGASTRLRPRGRRGHLARTEGSRSDRSPRSPTRR